jgi:lysophospholipase L1-like esterase
MLALLIVALLSASAPAATINLLPLGDSITAQALYYAPLQSLLSADHISSDIIANEGHSGYLIDGSLPGSPRPGMGLADNIGVGKNPDFLSPPPPIPAPVNASNTYILLMIGTNDVDTGFDLATNQVQSRMSNLISEIRTEAPLAHLIVAEIVPNLGTGKDPAVQQFNTDIAGVVHGPNVTLVDMYHPFESYPGFSSDPSLLMADNLHPNQTGGNVMAQVWFQGILAAQQQVPEPSSMILCGFGAIGLLIAARRRRAI